MRRYHKVMAITALMIVISFCLLYKATADEEILKQYDTELVKSSYQLMIKAENASKQAELCKKELVLNQGRFEGALEIVKRITAKKQAEEKAIEEIKKKLDEDNARKKLAEENNKTNEAIEKYVKNKS